MACGPWAWRFRSWSGCSVELEGTRKTILIVAGEASGDQAAAPVVAALRRLRPEWRLLATGGV